MKILIYPNLNKRNALKITLEACDILIKLGVEIFFEEKYISVFSQDIKVRYGEINQLISECDIVIVVGGDGTILQCSKIVGFYNKPILGINSGRLGFMASLEPFELDSLKKLITGDYTIENRMMLDATVFYNDGTYLKSSALNDVVVARGQFSKIADFEVSSNDQLVSSLRADGIIFSTPTGATAYSLSAGGPIIEPDMECIEFTQICPHSLFARTMVFSPNKTIQVKFKSNKNAIVSISVDGDDGVTFSSSDKLIIKKSDVYIKFIDITGCNFYRSINHKLMQPLKGVVEGLE